MDCQIFGENDFMLTLIMSFTQTSKQYLAKSWNNWHTEVIKEMCDNVPTIFSNKMFEGTKWIRRNKDSNQPGNFIINTPYSGSSYQIPFVAEQIKKLFDTLQIQPEWHHEENYVYVKLDIENIMK